MCESNSFPRRSLARRLLAPALILFLLAALHASASVGLVRFEIVPQAGEFLSVQWETASETNTALFRLYRSLEELPLNSANWGATVHEEPAKADLAGAAYVYPDYDVTSAVRYWYMLEEVTSTGGTQRLRVATGGINLPTLTPTSTTAAGTAPTGTPTPTQAPGGSQPAATATQRYTNTPPPLTPVVATPTAAGGVQPSATPLPPAVVATPTGSAAAATLFVPAAGPTVAPAATLALSPTPTATVAVIAAQPSPEVTKTPLVFQATASAAGTPAVSETGAAPARNTQRLLLFGGGAIALAAVLAVAVVFAMRARRR